MWSQLASLASQVSETVAPVAQEFKEALREDETSSSLEVPEQSSTGAGWLSTVAGGVKGIQQALAESDDEEDQASMSEEPSKTIDPFAEPEFHFKFEESASVKPPVARVPPATSLWGMVNSVKGALHEFHEALQEESDLEDRASETSQVAKTTNERAEEEDAIEASEKPIGNKTDGLSPQRTNALESATWNDEKNIFTEHAFGSSMLAAPLEDRSLETSKNTSSLGGSDARPSGNERSEASDINSELEILDERPAEVVGIESSEIESGLEGSNEYTEEMKNAGQTQNMQSEDTLLMEEHFDQIDTVAIGSFKNEEEIEYTEETKDTSSGNSSIVNVEVGEIMKSAEAAGINEQGIATPEDFELVVDEHSDGPRSDTRALESGDSTMKDDSVLPSEVDEVLPEVNQATDLGKKAEPDATSEPIPHKDALAIESISPKPISPPFADNASPSSTVAVSQTRPEPDTTQSTAVAESTSTLVLPPSASSNRRGRRGQQKRQSAERQALPTQQQQATNVDQDKDKIVQAAATSGKFMSPPNSRSQKKARGRGNQKSGATSVSSPSLLSPTNESATLPVDAPVAAAETSPRIDNAHSTDGSPPLANKDIATTELPAPQQVEQVGELLPPTDSRSVPGISTKEEIMMEEIAKLKAEIEVERSARLSGRESSKDEMAKVHLESERIRQELEMEKALRQKGMEEAAQKEKATQMTLQELHMKHSQAVETVKNLTDRMKSMEAENRSAIESLQNTTRVQMSEMENNLARVVAEKAKLQKELVVSREALENASRSSDKQRETNRALAERAMQSEQAQQQEIEKLAGLLREKEDHIARAEESFKQHNLQLRNEMSKLESELSKFAGLQQDLDFALAENASLREKAESLASKAELDHALQEVESLRSELARRESVHLQRVQVLEAELEATKADVVSLTTSSETAKNDVGKLHKALMRTTADLEKEESSHRQKVSAMRAEMSRAKDEHEAELAKAAEKQDELRQEIGRLRDEIAALKRSISASSSVTTAEYAIDPRVISNLVFAFVKRGRENGDTGRKEVVETMARMLEWTEAQRVDVMNSLTPSATASTSAAVARGIDLLLSSSSSNAAESKNEASKKKSILTTEVAAKLLERESFEDVFFKEFLAKESSGTSAFRRGSLTKLPTEVQLKTPLSSRALNQSNNTASPLPVASPTNEKTKSMSEMLSDEPAPSMPTSPDFVNQEIK